MVNDQDRKKDLAKRAGISAVIIGIISLGILGYFIRLYWIGPRCTTCFFHFNIDYRLGDEEVEDTIIREPYYKLLKMYERHPKWDFTIECQAAMIERIYENDEYEEIAELTDNLIERGQMELICGIQYSQLFYMYPADVLVLNLKYANQTLDEYGLLKKRSRALLFQEGQYGYGLATIMNNKWAGNIDTVLVSHQQIADFQRYNYLGKDYPVYELTNTETGKSINLLQYDYLPKWEAGYMHSWNFLLDAELGFEKKNAEKEFMVDDKKIAAYEQYLIMLELEGNQFMTCSDWISHCEKVDAVGKLNYYIPECNWGTTQYNSSYIWAANNGDSTDDGEMLANNYRCRQIIMATREVYKQFKNDPGMTSNNRSQIKNIFEVAEKLWLQATCTDSTGIGPDATERITAEGNIFSAEKKCAQILEIIANQVPQLNVSRIQVDLQTNSIYNNTNNFISLIKVLGPLSINDLPLDIDISSKIEGGGDAITQIEVSKVEYNSSDSNDDVFNLTRLDVTFEGTHDWADDSIHKISIKFSIDDWNVREIVYSPSLLENYTKRIWRYDYMYDPVYVFLPLSNGLLFLPDDYTGFQGIAIIKNITCRHTSWLWEYYYIEVLEDEGLHMDAHHQFYIMEDVSLETALNFANRINVSPPWVVSQNTSLIQGNEVYDMYVQMKNKLSDEDEGSGEWW